MRIFSRRRGSAALAVLGAGGSTTFGLLGSGSPPASRGSVQCTAH